jgi:1-acyl-sn-glycerol-3-phosphate acyltransferase
MQHGHKEERGSKLRKVFGYIHSVVFWSLAVLYTLIAYGVSYVAALFIKDPDRKKAVYQRSAGLWGWLLAGASLVKVNVTGLENIPADTNVIFAPNHQSYLDIFILLKYLPQPYRFIIMRQLFKVPVVGSHITKSGFISLDRKDRKGTLDTIDRVVGMLKNNESFVIFPEGQLTTDGNLGEFGRGASVIIQRSKKPVVPIAIDGTFGVLPKGAWVLKPAKVNVRIGKPVYFTDYYDEINKATSSKLGSALREIISDLKGGSSRELC